MTKKKKKRGEEECEGADIGPKSELREQKQTEEGKSGLGRERKVEEGSWRGGGVGMREVLGVEAVSKVWTNSKSNRVSHVAGLCRAGVLKDDTLPFLRQERSGRAGSQPPISDR